MVQKGMIGLLLKRLKEALKEKEWPLRDSQFFKPFQRIIEGSPVGPEDILGLDDYSLWVFIQQLAQMSKFDITIADLAQRIVARDLFKLVPCNEDKLAIFLGREDAHGRLYNAVSPFCQGSKEYYVLVDRARFRMLCERPSEFAYFVDNSSEDREATPIREHPQLRPYWQEPQVKTRLFALREAVESLSKLLQNS